MKYNSNLIIIALISFITLCYAQETSNWCFGFKSGIKFNNDTTLTFISKASNIEANASISDSNGNLLFYLSVDNKSGITNNLLLDAEHNVISNSEYLNVNTTNSNGFVIIPFPSDKNTYITIYDGLDYIDYSTIPYSYCHGLYYSIVKVLDNDSVFVTSKNIPLLRENIEEKIAVTRHANGQDWWLIAHKSPSECTLGCTNLYYKFKIDKNGFSNVELQNIGEMHCNELSVAGEMGFSYDGTKLVHVARGDNFVEVLDFDRCSGELSLPRAVNIINPYGCEISKTNKFIYISNINEPFEVGRNKLFQFDLRKDTVINIWENNNNDMTFGQMEMGGVVEYT